MIAGYIRDTGTDDPLPYVNILIEETGDGTISDSTGYFELSGLCAEGYHLVFSHIGCESREVFIALILDTIINVQLEHSAHQLEDVTVTGTNIQVSTQQSSSITQQVIDDGASDNLANLLDNIVGVSTLKNGTGIAKPVVHGLYGNRLAILNNGIVQSGQQWGNDHSPEIDPLVATRLRVIKGVGALAYPGARLGGVILVEPQRIDKEPHLHGKASYFYESNGRKHGVNLQAQQYKGSLGWRLNGTLKKGGDRRTPDYFLTNTGSAEANLAFQLDKSWTTRLKTEIYASTFNTELGILRGSQVGNLTDLASALDRDVPFFTAETFSYDIDAPKQVVGHHLIKTDTKYFLDDDTWLSFILSGQANVRKEFDVRRAGRSELPALSLTQMAYYAALKYNHVKASDWTVKTGIEAIVTDNTNNPETGILPLVPDYLSYEPSLYGVVSKTYDDHTIEVGLRYDLVLQNVATIDVTQRDIVRYQNLAHNLSSTIGWSYALSDHIDASVNLGYAARNPAVNELYSAGLHQGVSGIEEGSIDLNQEHAIKMTAGISGDIDERLSFEVLGYYQHISDYIYLNPQEEFRLTIRGAFPVFRYEQADARIYGLDLSTQFQISDALFTSLDYSYIRGDEIETDVALVNIPSDNIRWSAAYEFPQSIQVGSKRLENLQLELNTHYQMRQHRISFDQDFVLPPDDYFLLGAKVSTDIQLGKTRLRWYANVDNLLNTVYRDYLNRQRYFADDIGINVTTGVALKF